MLGALKTIFSIIYKEVLFITKLWQNCVITLENDSEVCYIPSSPTLVYCKGEGSKNPGNSNLSYFPLLLAREE